MKNHAMTAPVLRRLLLVAALAVLPLCGHAAAGTAEADDSLSYYVLRYAARGESENLRPLMEAEGAKLPRDVRLYGEMALARADYRWQRVVECIDTLTTDYDSRLDVKTRLSLSMLKAETLRRMGNYAGMARYCDEQVYYYRGRHVKKQLLTPFRTMAAHGRRLGGSDARSEALRLADLDDAFTLQHRHAARLAALDDYARRRCRLTLAAAFGRHHAAAAIADSLLRENADSLEVADRLLCLHTAARSLAAEGDWAALKAFVDAHQPSEAAASGGDILQHYRRLAAALGGCEATGMELPFGHFESYVTGESPTRIGGSIDGQSSLTFNVFSGIAHNIIADTDTADAGLVFADDAVDILTPFGIAPARPALCPRLAVGNAVVTNALVYVVHADDEAFADGMRTLGLNLLMKFGSVTFYPERLVSQHEEKADDAFPTSPNLRLTADQTLMAEAALADSPRRFLIDNSYALTLLSPDLLLTAAETGYSIAPRFGNVTAAPSAVFPEEDAGFETDGVLGHPFVAANCPLTLDFRTMTISLPTASERVAPSHSPLYIHRNFADLQSAAGSRQKVRTLTGQYLLWTNRPQDFSSSVWNVGEDGDTDSDKSDTAVWNRCRREAEALLGHYAAAAAIATPVPAAADTPAPAVWRHFPATAEPSLSLNGVAVSPYTDAASLTTGCTVNDKEALMRPDLSLSPLVPVIVPAKAAKRLKVKTCYRPKEKNSAPSYGLIEELHIGTATLRNVFCRIDPGKEETLRYGTGLLRLFPKVKFGKAGMVVLAASPPSPSGAPMLIADGLSVQGEVPTGFADVRLTTAPSEAATASSSLTAVVLSGTSLQMPFLRDGAVYELSLPQCVAAGHTVTLDFEGMFFTLD